MAVSMRSALCGVALGAVLAVSGCGYLGGDDKPAVRVDGEATHPAGSTMAGLKKAGTIRIGVKFDQPNVGYLKKGAEEPEGFDVEIAKIIAGRMGIPPEKITWVEAVSKDRESLIRDRKVDLVVASYSITDERRKLVGMAGPYYETGQQLLVRKDNTNIKGPEDLSGKRVCAATGSTSLAKVEKEYGALPSPASTYKQCVDRLGSGTVDAVTTDGAILLGFAADDPEKLKVVGEPFTIERYGVGYGHGNTEMCHFVSTAIRRSHNDGSWIRALSKTLWRTTGPTPPPDVDPCE
ncbi:glutamate ABC transporter substrate-binding protein [Streptomyces alkaliterrae]|uniref:Glutamate ABC transporter substrate-binding protein n=1 Tax=Streptomyces alkaliterrae TaxID=2213162 RepID=A0A5P0YRA6_9ACTN|nr:glutamate ABC transporter substrate-binding protein [Streptomyces alkaliterrae]MBB1252220.1 glutamate ABC transporter substrate-binding protein [Streptomyces alkaliterrae]MBB1260414.1 glutamate ABC transporter substrate-binding protein [Streptomyces alkaliterrae]MQS02147.1 transporter substrate-binding domain-containing protein [Streptomyces alkaliterrae]